MRNHVIETEASYFLFRLEGKRWLFLTFVPDRVNIKDKMLYASAKGTLKSKLGFSNFDEDFHVTKLDDLSYSHYSNEKKPVDSRSSDEVLRDKMNKEEEQERESRKGKIGGYHAVSIPLSQAAKDEFEKFKQNQINFIELSIDNEKQGINAVNALSVTDQLSSHISEAEPRFYVYRHQGTPVFIYCCPDKSPQKLRMVYSTSKPQVATQIQQLGINLAAKRMEVTEASEITPENISAAVNPRPSYAANSAPVAKSPAKASAVTAPHPIYSLMNQQNQDPTKKKKIVLPPSGAW